MSPSSLFDATTTAFTFSTRNTGFGSSGSTRGWKFSGDGTRTLTHLGIYSDSSFPNDNERSVGLWQGGSLVASVTFFANDPTDVIHEACCSRGWSYKEITPHIVLSGTYTIGIPYLGSNGPGTFCPTSGSAYESGITFIESVTLNSATGLQEPTNTYGGCTDGAIITANFRLRI